MNDDGICENCGHRKHFHNVYGFCWSGPVNNEADCKCRGYIAPSDTQETPQ